MCSITNTAHPRNNVLVLSSSLLILVLIFSRVFCCHVYMFACCHVNKLPCLYVVSSHPYGMLCIYGDRSEGSCNQGKGRLRVIKYQFTRRHSFCNFYQECTLTRFSRNRQKKTSSSDKVSFISPIRYPDRFGF